MGVWLWILRELPGFKCGCRCCYSTGLHWDRPWRILFSKNRTGKKKESRALTRGRGMQKSKRKCGKEGRTLTRCGVMSRWKPGSEQEPFSPGWWDNFWESNKTTREFVPWLALWLPVTLQSVCMIALLIIAKNTKNSSSMDTHGRTVN